jgi:protein tyrosine phosphatase (PTP) superfamily phosphohydrolase (DUF442 family)
MSDFFYCVSSNKLYAGAYPGDPDPVIARQKLTILLELGVSLFINMMEADERDWNGRLFAPYEAILSKVAEQAGVTVVHHRVPVKDVNVPSGQTMQTILEMIQSANKETRSVYVHCRGGIGRTGTAVGCYLVAQGMDGREALRQIGQLRADLDARLSPETEQQRQFVLRWTKASQSGSN